MKITLRVKLPASGHKQVPVVSEPPREPVTVEFPTVEVEQGDALLRLNNSLTAYEVTAPMNVTVHESAVTTLEPAESTQP